MSHISYQNLKYQNLRYPIHVYHIILAKYCWYFRYGLYDTPKIANFEIIKLIRWCQFWSFIPSQEVLVNNSLTTTRGCGKHQMNKTCMSLWKTNDDTITSWFPEKKKKMSTKYNNEYTLKMTWLPSHFLGWNCNLS